MTVSPPTCPHCRASLPDAEYDWSRFQTGDGTGLCPHCQKSLPGGERAQEAPGFHPGLKFVISLLVISALMFWLNSIFDVLSFKDDPGQILYELVFAGLVSAYLASGRLTAKLKGLLVWATIFMVAMLVYAYRHDLAAVKDRMQAALIPEFGSAAGSRTLRFHVGEDGHFHIRARVNGVPVRFLVDTGASHIVLSRRDAERLGIDLWRLDFDKIYATANGMVRAATIVAAEFEVGNLNLKDVRASVNEAPMGESLLFNRMQRYAVEDDVLTIQWADR